MTYAYRIVCHDMSCHLVSSCSVVDRPTPVKKKEKEKNLPRFAAAIDGATFLPKNRTIVFTIETMLEANFPKNIWCYARAQNSTAPVVNIL